jgi:hypothetical protein
MFLYLSGHNVNDQNRAVEDSAAQRCRLLARRQNNNKKKIRCFNRVKFMALLAGIARRYFMQNIGTCSICGGAVQIPTMWGGSIPPTPQCSTCGATPEAPHGRVIKMVPAKKTPPWDVAHFSGQFSFAKTANSGDR